MLVCFVVSLVQCSDAQKGSGRRGHGPSGRNGEVGERRSQDVVTAGSSLACEAKTKVPIAARSAFSG